MRRHSTVLKFLCAALLTFVTAVALARGALLEIEARTANTNRFMRHRLREMISSLPLIAKTTGPVTLVLGSSDMEIEFHPDVFDSEFARRGQKMTSYNLAVRNSLAVFPQIVKRIKESGIAPEIAIVKFTPTYLTKAAKPLWSVSDDVKSSLGGVSFNQLFFDGMSPAMARYYVSDWFNAFRQFKMSDGSPLLFRNRELNGGVAWDFSKRGFFYFGWPHQPNLEKVLTEYRQPDVQEAVASFHRRCCDADGLHFDAELLHRFIEALRELRSFSKNTYLVYYPDHIPRSGNANDRLLSTFDMVVEQSGVQSIDIGNIFSRQDFIDPVHLSVEAGAKLSKRMAELLATTPMRDRFPSSNSSYR